MHRIERSVVILAAGVGSRLRPLTDRLPKALVPVDGKPILGYALDALAARAAAKRCEISVVVGYRGDQIASFVGRYFPFARIVWNHDYAKTNNMFSLFLATQTVPPWADLVFMNGDCLYEKGVLDQAMNGTGSRVFCDPAREYNDESMKIVLSGGSVSCLSKSVPRSEAYAVSTDLYAIAAADTVPLRSDMFERITQGEVNSWTEVALDAAMRSRAIDFRAEPVGGYWYEIDDSRDLDAATRLVRGATQHARAV